MVFLSKKENIYESLLDYDLGTEYKQQHEKNCKSPLPEYFVMFHGIGIFDEEHHEESKSNSGFIIPTDLIKLPKKTKYYEPAKSNCHPINKCKLVDRDSLFEILTGKKKKSDK